MDPALLLCGLEEGGKQTTETKQNETKSKVFTATKPNMN